MMRRRRVYFQPVSSLMRVFFREKSVADFNIRNLPRQRCA